MTWYRYNRKDSTVSQVMHIPDGCKHPESYILGVLSESDCPSIANLKKIMHPKKDKAVQETLYIKLELAKKELLRYNKQLDLEIFMKGIVTNEK